MKKVDVVIAGVGGQGNLLVASIIAQTALDYSWEAKRSEIKGLAQRGGSVQSLVRVGEKVWSPLIEKGTADILLGLEPVEALRNVQFLSPAGKAIVSKNFAPNPIPYSQEEVLEKVRAQGFILIPAVDLAKEAGNPQCLNVVLLGAASHFFPFPAESFKQTIKKIVKRLQEVNQKAFDLGREAVTSTS